MTDLALNTLGPGDGAKKTGKRVGRGIGSGKGKTCGKGHKGLKARSGGKVKIGFEGGQTPLYRRIPKRGFNSFIATVTQEVRLDQLKSFSSDDAPVGLETLKSANIIRRKTRFVKIIKAGEINSAITVDLSGNVVKLTTGARKSIEAAGGKILEIERR